DCRQQAKHLHRLEHALYVATAAIVTAEAKSNSRLTQINHRRNSALQFQIAQMIEHDSGVCRRHTLHFRTRYPDAVHDIEAGPKQPATIEVIDQRAPMLLELIARNQRLAAGLIDMGVNAKIMLVGEVGAAPQQFRRATLRCEWRCRPMDRAA